MSNKAKKYPDEGVEVLKPSYPNEKRPPVPDESEHDDMSGLDQLHKLTGETKDTPGKNSLPNIGLDKDTLRALTLNLTKLYNAMDEGFIDLNYNGRRTIVSFETARDFIASHVKVYALTRSHATKKEKDMAKNMMPDDGAPIFKMELSCGSVTHHEKMPDGSDGEVIWEGKETCLFIRDPNAVFNIDLTLAGKPELIDAINNECIRQHDKAPEINSYMDSAFVKLITDDSAEEVIKKAKAAFKSGSHENA